MKQEDRRKGYRNRKLTNTNALNNLSLRGVPRFAGRRSNPKKNEIAAPFALYTMRCPEPYRFRAVQGFGLAMTCKEIYCI